MITEVEVKNFRSLRDSKLSLGRLVVLIGPNGSGKSNLIDALKVMHALVAQEQDARGEFAARGGYGEIVWGGDTEEKISIRINWHDESQPEASWQSYAERFGHGEFTDVVLEREELLTSGGQAIKRTEPTQYSFEESSTSRSSGSVQSYESAVRMAGNRLASPNVVQSMHQWAFYRFEPVTMRQPQPVRKEYKLNESGQNLSAVVHTLFSDDDPALGEIVDVLKACVPAVEKLSSPITDDGRTYVALKEKWVPMPVGSWGLSDGTLLALALATAVMTPRPPTLIAFEAPDTELHPHVMETLAEMLKVASESTQVIITTHSPYLLDFLPLEAFVVVEKRKGETEFRPLKNRRDAQRVVKELGVGDAWVSGHLGGVP